MANAKLEGSRETQRERCPTCGSSLREHVWVGDKYPCPDPWHGTPTAPETPPDSEMGVWTEEELKHFVELASGPQPAPTEHLVRAMSSPKKES